MGGKSDYLENKILSHNLGRVLYTPPLTLYMALFNTSPGDDGGGSEVGGTGYARVSISNAPSKWNGSDHERFNADEILFPSVGVGAWGTIVSFALMDAPSAGNMLYWGDLDEPVETEDGDTIKFDPGAITITES